MPREEKIIGGRLCWREQPFDAWKCYTPEELSKMVVELKLRVRVAKNALEGKRTTRRGRFVKRTDPALS